MKSICLKSPAKLNLYLKVIRKRPDGYHDIVTLFERINLFDEIRLTANPTGKIRIHCQNPGVPSGPKNLMYQAAELLKNDFHLKEGVDIKITKRIPVAAGLGGGSSNAASVLLGLNTIWGLSLSHNKLLGYARQLGSDVPFFMYNCRFALGTQRGDRIKPLKLNKTLWHVVVVPRFKLYSHQVYGALNLRMLRSASLSVSTRSTLKGKRLIYTNVLTKINDDVKILIHALKKNDLPKVGSLLLNNLETAAVGFHPNLLKIKELMRRSKGCGVVLAGSGPAVFGLLGTRYEALELKKELRRLYKRVFVVRTY